MNNVNEVWKQASSNYTLKPTLGYIKTDSKTLLSLGFTIKICFIKVKYVGSSLENKLVQNIKDMHILSAPKRKSPYIHFLNLFTFFFFSVFFSLK